MKLTIKLYIVAIFVALVQWCHGADVVKEQKNLLDRIDIQTIGVYRSVDFESARYGAGALLGVSLNKYVTLGLSLVAYENGSERAWGGAVIDETSLLVQASLLRSDNGKLELFAVGGGARDWQHDDWAFGCGLGTRLNITKRFYAESSAQVRAWIHGGRDIFVPFGVGYKF